jgi:alpha-1,6-mannosyltransferase
VMLVMLGTWLLVRHRRIVAGVAIALATLVKPYAIVALPACWRPWDWRLPLAVIGTVVACYLPYWGVGKDVFGFLLTGYLTEEGLQGGDGFWLVFVARTLFGNVSGLMPLYLALAAAVLGYFALRVCFTPDDTPERTIRNVALLLMAGLFFLTPNYPWYFLVVVPFIPIGGGAPAWALSLGAILLNLLYPDYEARFLVWKGVIVIGFIVAVTATMQPTLLARLEGTLRWKR